VETVRFGRWGLSVPAVTLVVWSIVALANFLASLVNVTVILE
jgi:hypothetical protein